MENSMSPMKGSQRRDIERARALAAEWRTDND